jgi:ubiquinone/menaquinone biosynthesis C-methylase UbiE
MQTDEPELQMYYAARAPEYDDVYRKPERQQDLRAIEQWLPRRFTDATVLEIACGTGYWTQFIAQTARHIHAVDAAPQTLRVAKDRVPADKVTFVTGDAYQLPLHLGRFGAAFAGFWFSHVPKSRRVAFLRGLHAVLDPGAIVAGQPLCRWQQHTSCRNRRRGKHLPNTRTQGRLDASRAQKFSIRRRAAVLDRRPWRKRQVYAVAVLLGVRVCGLQ